MHELSIALSLIEMAVDEGAARNARVLATHVRLGRLSGVVKEALQSAFAMAAEGTPLEGTALVIDDVPVVVHCAVCDADRPTRRDDWLACDVCGTASASVVSGRELELTALELE
jgi:hydrogenase nickel incorporation protein HypA/HybF